MLRQRPISFLLKSDHLLAKGLVFAGLGRSPRSVRYTDSSPYGNHGTLTAMDPATDWVWVPDLNRFALDFDGSNDYVAVAGSTLSPVPMTVCAWARSTSAPANYSGIVTNSNSSYLNGYGIIHYNRQLRFFVSQWNANFSDIAYATPTAWNHVCGTYDGTNIVSYLNGVPGTLDTFGTMTDAGAFQISDSTYLWTGRICDVCLYSRALSSTEILQLADPSNVMLSGLIQPPKRKYYGITIPLYTTKRYYKIGKRILRA